MPACAIPALPVDRPLLALAPMQEVTDLAFWTVLHPRGEPDLWFTEYLRVHRDSNPQKEREVLAAVDGRPGGRPVAVQMIGRDVPALVRTADFLQRRGGIAAIDLNLGCPAPKVCSKQAGGGLLRDPDAVDAILAALRETITECAFTVKTRVGFGTPDEFDRLLDVFARHRLDLLSVHGRTVRDGYVAPVRHDRIAEAVRRLPFPVLANGNVVSVESGLATLRATGAAGLMIGRGVIRNPFLFAQLRAALEGRPAPPEPTRRDLHAYVHALWEANLAHRPDRARGRRRAVHTSPLTRLKRYLNFVAAGIDDGRFLHEIRRAGDEDAFFRILDRHLGSDDGAAAVPAEDPRPW